MSLDGVKSGAKISEKYPGRSFWGVKMLQKEMEDTGQSILCSSLSFIGKPKGVQLFADGGLFLLFFHVVGILQVLYMSQ